MTFKNLRNLIMEKRPYRKEEWDNNFDEYNKHIEILLDKVLSAQNELLLRISEYPVGDFNYSPDIKSGLIAREKGLMELIEWHKSINIF